MFNFPPVSPEGALPPQDVRFTDLRCEMWPDGQRVRVHATITPFEKRPTLDARILDREGEEVTSTSIIETMDNKLVFTMHLRGRTAPARYTLTATLSYEETGKVDERRVEVVSGEQFSEEPS